MAAFRVLGQFVQYFLDNGQVNDGGSVAFFETDLTTPKNTYTDPTLTVPNSNPVDLTADGRLSSDVWGDGEYGAELRDADGVVLETLNNIQSGADPGFVIPALVAGAYLTNDGSNLQWDTDVSAQLLPDMTGEAGNILYTDGTIAYWDAPPAEPEIPDPEIVITTTPNKTFRAGISTDTTKKFEQFGTDTVSPSGTKTVTKSVTFPTAFTALWFVTIQNISGAATASGAWPTWSTTAVSATGFTVTFNIPDDDSNSNWQISNTINFNWKAEGTLVVP